MTQLLVSVRSATEALTALAGGADVIDVKEPSRGALGRADEAIIAEVVRAVGERRPVSAAMGELADVESVPAPPDVAFVKFGLAACVSRDWQHLLDERERLLSFLHPSCILVPVAYADWRRAAAPSVDEVTTFAVERPGGILLIDTWGKDGSTLLDWLPVAEVVRLCESCRRTKVRIALAGSLGSKEIERLLPARPDWIAVRGAACWGKDRGSAIDEERVRRLATLLRTRPVEPTASASERYLPG
jgi:uncharacterized protein (UPF0264 family)